jgi:hypothetical protein
MAIVANSPSTVPITGSTVDQAVGLCYFDPTDESLLELSQLPDHYITLQPHKVVMRKYYLVVDPSEVISYIRVKVPNNDGMDNLFSIKTIIGNDEPQVGSFEALPEYNSFKINNPTAGAFIPVWILIESKTPLNEVLNMDIEVEYE